MNWLVRALGATGDELPYARTVCELLLRSSSVYALAHA